MKPLQIGETVQYAKKFLRNIGTSVVDPLWFTKGVVVGVGSHATTWHCSACREELGYQSPTNGRKTYDPPAMSPCCSAELYTVEHTSKPSSMRAHGHNVVRVCFDRDPPGVETAILECNLSRIGKDVEP